MLFQTIFFKGFSLLIFQKSKEGPVAAPKSSHKFFWQHGLVYISEPKGYVASDIQACLPTLQYNSVWSIALKLISQNPNSASYSIFWWKKLLSVYIFFLK